MQMAKTNKELFEQARDLYTTETNETERSLATNLMLVSTVAITITLVGISNDHIMQILSQSSLPRLALIMAFVFEIKSIACGISHFIQSQQFFNKIISVNQEVVRLYSVGEINDSNGAEKTIKMQQDAFGKETMSSFVMFPGFLYGQIAYLGVSFIIFVLVIGYILFL
ncbi:MAG: hypothetical protein JWO07_116 [Candidatus Saccharibacteria bacterium]|nr:hypothetical protein [Candidatus Saccharibacteria bacterium]